MSDELELRLASFRDLHKIESKGSLSLMIVLTRLMKEGTPPFTYEEFQTQKQGQVRGLGKSAVQKVLSDYGIEKVLAQEGGRTSRGNMERMTSYVDFVNGLDKDGLLDCNFVEKWWVERVKVFLLAKPMKVSADSSKSLRCIVDDILTAAYQRQSTQLGSTVAGAVLQHLVGAKLVLALPDYNIKHHGYSVSDEQTDRKGDFLVRDSAIHVTTTPGEALMDRCLTNLNQGFQPIIITRSKGMEAARVHAEAKGLANRVDVVEIGQFIATNIYEWMSFKSDKRSVEIRRLLDTYNQIIDSVETDPGLKLVLS